MFRMSFCSSHLEFLLLLLLLFLPPLLDCSIGPLPDSSECTELFFILNGFSVFLPHGSPGFYSGVFQYESFSEVGLFNFLHSLPLVSHNHFLLSFDVFSILPNSTFIPEFNLHLCIAWTYNYM